MTNEERDIQRKLECFCMQRRSAMPVKHAGISGLGDPASIDGGMRIKSMAKLVWRMRNLFQRTPPIKRHQRSWKRFCICAANIT